LRASGSDEKAEKVKVPKESLPRNLFPGRYVNNGTTVIEKPGGELSCVEIECDKACIKLVLLYSNTAGPPRPAFLYILGLSKNEQFLYKILLINCFSF